MTMLRDEERRKRITMETKFWRAKADQASQLEHEQIREKLKIYQPYVGIYNREINTQLNFKSLIFNKYLIVLLCLITFEYFLLTNLPVQILTQNPSLSSIIEKLSILYPKIGYSVLTMSNDDWISFVSYPELWRVYMAIATFVLLPLKTCVVTSWLNAERKYKYYRVFVTSPLTILRIGAEDDYQGDLDYSVQYRSLFNRLLWSIIYLLISLVFYWILFYGNEIVGPLLFTAGSISFAISICIIKDYYIFFQIQFRQLLK